MRLIKPLTWIIALPAIIVVGCGTEAPIRLDRPALMHPNADSAVRRIEPIATFQHEDPVQSISLTPSGRYFAVGGQRKVVLWDVILQKQVQSLEGGTGTFSSIAFSPDGGILAAGSYQGIELWDIETGKHMTTFVGHTGSISSVAFGPYGKLLASGSSGADTEIILWDVENRKLAKRLVADRGEYSDMVRFLAFSEDGRRLASISLDRKIRIWDLEAGSPKPVQTLFDPSTTPLTMVFSPHGTTLLSGTFEGRLVLFDLERGTILKNIPAHRGRVFSVDFSPSGTTIVSTGWDKAIRRWHLETGVSLKEERLNYEARPNAVTFQETRIALATSNETVVFPLTREGAVPPVIAILTPSDQAEVYEPSIRLTGKVVDDVGIEEVKIELNGVLVMSTSDFKVRDLKIEAKESKGEVLLDRRIRLKAGNNKITVTAYDTDGLLRSEVVRVRYIPEQGEVWAVVIGISKYAHVSGLRYADADAREFYNYLVGENNLPEDHVTLLLNEAATLQRLKDVLGVDLKKKARKQDTVIIYYAGHGAPEPDPSSVDGDGLEKYLLPYDADPKRLYSTALPMAEVSKIFSRISAERVVMLQDTCFSGSSEIGGRTIQTAMFRAPISDTFLNRLTQGKGRVIIAASEANEVSIERDDLGHGVFTYYLLEAFSKGDIDGDGLITTNEVFRYLSEKVPEATGQTQHPVKKGVETREIILGKVRMKG